MPFPAMSHPQSRAKAAALPHILSLVGPLDILRVQGTSKSYPKCVNEIEAGRGQLRTGLDRDEARGRRSYCRIQKMKDFILPAAFHLRAREDGQQTKFCNSTCEFSQPIYGFPSTFLILNVGVPTIQQRVGFRIGACRGPILSSVHTTGARYAIRPRAPAAASRKRELYANSARDASACVMSQKTYHDSNGVSSRRRTLGHESKLLVNFSRDETVRKLLSRQALIVSLRRLGRVVVY
ncbi:hypothetical protein EVAR_93652_1 [Eumeta japonica]|uniref:Uncharacterized protein n=1 Tax=Eumeta variegata TaxID=151549 RepID=A0A4C1TQT9_EUMVA|nr:hypothetical protein EVAR_93652_1 [Eumeta japonica]